MSRHIAPLRDRRSPVAATPHRKIKFQNRISVEFLRSWKSHLHPSSDHSRRSRRRIAPRRDTAAAQSQQTQYLGEAAETSGTAATGLELPIPETLFWAATHQQFPSAITIPAQSTIRRAPTLHIWHIQAPSPLAQASVRSPLTLQKERTRKLQVHMGLAASTTARIFPSNR